MTVDLFVFELLDDFLYVALGALLYSYSRQLFGSRGAAGRRASHVVNGLAFGLLATALMAQGVPMAGGVIVDARNVPVALIALFDGWLAGLLAAGVAAAFRFVWGGPGAAGGAVALLATAVAGGLAYEWARREGRVRPRHALTLSAAAFVIVCSRFLVLGPAGLPILRRVWASYLLLTVVGIGLLARLFQDVLERERVAELRAIALLANAAAHEINNPLAVVLGALELLRSKVPPDGLEGRLLGQGVEAVDRIKDIVTRMTRVTRVERLPGEDERLPALLDIRRSSESG
jgi:signal transduction histidine kinase